MRIRNSLVRSLVVIIGGVLLAGACSDAIETTGPPIPTLDAAATGTGVETVADGPLNAQCGNCVEWGCSIAECGYDTATDPRGACCLDCDFSQPSVPKPSCEPPGGGGETLCSDLLSSGEFFGDYCRADIERDTASAFFDVRCVSPAEHFLWFGSYGPADTGNYYFCSSCPTAFSCCHGGPWCGDPVVMY